MKTMIIFIIWIVCACFNTYKIYQSDTYSNVLESLFAIAFAPLYTLIAFMIAFIKGFIINKW